MNPRRINPDTGVIEEQTDFLDEFFGWWHPVDFEDCDED